MADLGDASHPMRNRRRDTGDLEIGFTDVLAKHPTAHLALDHAPSVSQRRLHFESYRPTWLRECLAETTGVFFYVWAGVSATAAMTFSLNEGITYFGNILTIGIAYGIGIAFAIITSAKTSGGHFNPAVTLCFVLFRGFPPLKAVRYVIFQMLGAFTACMVVYGSYYHTFREFEAATKAKGLPLVAATGPAGIFSPYPTGQPKGQLFVSEFLSDFAIALVIWSCLDPSNFFMSPTVAPWAIGLVYTVVVWGFAFGTISTNMARDVGSRFAGAVFYGPGVFTDYHHYSANSALVNLLSTVLAVLYYNLVMVDSRALIKAGHAMHPAVHRHLTQERQAAKTEQDEDEYGVDALLKRHVTNGQPATPAAPVKDDRREEHKLDKED